MPHLHLSLQSGDDMILKRMKRRHSPRRRDPLLRGACGGSGPTSLLGADLIAGFPTETEEMFENTLALVEECGLSLPARLPLLAAHRHARGAHAAGRRALVVKERAARLRDAAPRCAGRRGSRAEVGARRNVLVEQPGFGRTEHYLPVRLDRGERGEIVRSRIRGVTADEPLSAPPFRKRPDGGRQAQRAFSAGCSASTMLRARRRTRRRYAVRARDRSVAE